MSTTRRCAGHALALALLLLLVPGVGSAQGNRVDLRVLLVTDGAPPVEALRARLARPRDPGRRARPGRPRAAPDRRRAARRRAAARAIQGVVLPDQAPTGLPRAELAALHAYERRFGIRQLDASVDRHAGGGPRPSRPTPSATAARSTAVRRSSTPEALAGDFGYARGPVPFSDDEPGGGRRRGCRWPRRGAGFRPLLTATAPGGTRSGALAGVLGIAGREELVLTFSLRHRHPAAAGARARGWSRGSPAASTWGSTAATSPCTSTTCCCPTCAGCPGVHCAPGGRLPARRSRHRRRSG